MTDNNVIVALLEASRDHGKKGHDSARRIVCRKHFKVLYQRHPEDMKQNPEAGEAVFKAAQNEFDERNVMYE